MVDMLQFLGCFIFIDAIAFICTWHKQKKLEGKENKSFRIKRLIIVLVISIISYLFI